ncbi:molybdate ABC transporter substrate-binding protein [Saccharomonospora sp. CUA-673]|nr:molybdate ABC transporter substrate-binding protein [Saccharomonospora sp. CUA-673]
MKRWARRGAAAGAALILMAVGGCSPGGTDRTTLNVFAAASLTESFGELKDTFEREHPDVDVRLNLAGSSALARQIAEGAPADVFASADADTMADVADDMDGPARTFATNRLTIAVPAGNPRDIDGFADLAGPDVTLVVCQPQVPCGNATETLARASGTSLSPASEEQDVKDVLAKVVTGEADAGLVYATDVRSAGDAVEEVPIPGADEAVNRYPIAVSAYADEPELATEFRDLVLGEQGRAALEKAGFGTP